MHGTVNIKKGLTYWGSEAMKHYIVTFSCRVFDDSVSNAGDFILH